MKSKVINVVNKIPSYYVSSDCVQDMISYKGAITMFGPDGIMYHDDGNSIIMANKYIEDERRTRFPYSNIPVHYERVGLQKRTYTNQILDFEKPYIAISENCIVERYVIKDKEQALLMKNTLLGSKYTKYMTYDEVLKYIGKRNPAEKIYYINTDMVTDNYDKLFPSEERIYEYIKDKFIKNVQDFREYQLMHSDVVACYLKENPWFLDYIEQCAKNFDYSLIDFNLGIGNKNLIVRVNNGEISIQSIEVFFVQKDEYKVLICDIPVNRYTLEQIKYVSKVTTLKDPKIPLRINPNVTKKDIEEARQMVKALNSSKK